MCETDQHDGFHFPTLPNCLPFPNVYIFQVFYHFQLPIIFTGWGFDYRGVDQIFCCANEISRDSWIDAVSEAW